MTLMESYSKRLNISESVYRKNHEGSKMDNNRKLMIAKALDNTSKFLNESFESSMATQRSEMGLWKKFCLNLITVALPNLIAPELVIVSPMSSMSGYVTYINYVAGTTKGETEVEDLFNNPFQLGDAAYDEATGTYTNKAKIDARYTGNAVVEAISDTSAALTLAWTPVVKGAFTDETGAAKDVRIIAADGTVTFADLDEEGKVPAAALVEGGKIAYRYDNIVIPQAKLPTLKAEMKSISLIARARRIAIYYSQIAAFQSKTDYGLDLGDQLAQQAVGRLQYEIDTEVTDLLINMAGAPAAEMVWSKTLPVGVSKRDHYAGFAEVVEIAKQKVYDATKRFVPNYMLIASDILPVLTFIDGFKAASTSNINGPYFAGELNGLKVFVTPNIEAGKFVVGVNGSDMMSSAAVYAPYMPVVPTQLLQFADGTTSQGFSTLYDLKPLNKALVVAGGVVA